MGKRKRYQRPNEEQKMFIRKAGYDPYQCLVIWEDPTRMLIHRWGAGREILEK